MDNLLVINETMWAELGYSSYNIGIGLPYHYFSQYTLHDLFRLVVRRRGFNVPNLSRLY